MTPLIPGKDAIRRDQAMKPLDQSETNAIRLVIVRRDGSEILFTSPTQLVRHSIGGTGVQIHVHFQEPRTYRGRAVDRQGFGRP